MKSPALQLALALFLGFSAIAADTIDFYIGGYTRPGGSRGIQRGSLNRETGALKLEGLAAEAKNPSFLALHPNGKFLYAVAEQEGGAVAAYAIGKDGSLRKLNEESSKGAGNCHVMVDASGRNVLAANYGSGSVACLPVREDGSVGPASAFIQHSGSSVNPRRQAGPHAHSVYFNGAFAYACDLGTDDVFVYRFDAAKGSLTPNDPPSGKVPAGGGPRHLAFHPKSGFAYVNNEMTSSVTVFAHDAEKGTLKPLQTISTLPPGYAGADKNSTAEIFCHPNGRFVYVSNRGHDSIAVFAIGADGKLTSVEIAPANVKVPRNFAISPDGGWLVAAGQNSDSLASHRVNPETGRLTPAGELTGIGAPVCVLFAQPR
ncbi:MAG: lactonase family protein [Chthoniobacteraceae bacterium]